MNDPSHLEAAASWTAKAWRALAKYEREIHRDGEAALRAMLDGFRYQGAASTHLASLAGAPSMELRSNVDAAGVALLEKWDEYARMWFKRGPRGMLHGFF